MPLATRIQNTDAAERHVRVGDAVAALARRYAAVMNDCEFAIELREQRLTRERYVAFITSMYPCVVGFNRALIRSIAKVDHVRQSPLVGMLAEQLREEQAHNQMWRTMLERHDVDHEAVFAAMEDQFKRLSPGELTAKTDDVLRALTVDQRDCQPGSFTGFVFPEPVLAIYHYLWLSASDDSVDYWAHFASQCAIEMVIYEVVSTTVLPGLQGNRELDAGPEATEWWREHGRGADATDTRALDEEKHLELSRVALNRSRRATAISDSVIARAENTLRLFAATLTCQSVTSRAFPAERFLRRR